MRSEGGFTTQNSNIACLEVTQVLLLAHRRCHLVDVGSKGGAAAAAAAAQPILAAGCICRRGSEARRRFELLKRAYVEARYSDQYDASVEDLEWLMARARRLRDLVADLCRLRIATLKAKADIG